MSPPSISHTAQDSAPHLSATSKVTQSKVAPSRAKPSLRPILPILALGLLIGWLTLFRGYQDPTAFFWDENYHIVSAQKYLNLVFFQEPHPPLGKLLIAAGEYLLDANAHDDQFINTNHATNPPPGFLFSGYRFFPALLATLSVPLFSLLAFQLTRSYLAAFLCIAAFGFDNALVVHLRGAMLEGPQLFFLISSAVAALASSPLLAGVAAGAALATKVNSAPVVLILILTILFRSNHPALSHKLRGVFRFTLMALLTWLCVWQIHFALGQRLLANDYKAPIAYRTNIKAGEAGTLALFPHALSQALTFFTDYQTGVPALNMCKSQENGSYPLLWPLGGQSINYRWERKDGATRYLYLQINPAVWALSLLGALWALRCWSLKPLRFNAYTALVTLYLAGLLLPLLYDRVFYLYHFFIPLLCGLLASAKLVTRAEKRNPRTIRALSVLGILVIFLTFRYFAPLTYAAPLTDTQLAERAWLGLWNLRCPNCDSVYPLARPLPAGNSEIVISGIKATSVTQGWGTTRLGVADEGAPLRVKGELFHYGIGTHANGEIVFTVPEWAREFSYSVGVPDAYRGRASTLQFAVEADGKELWRSPIVRAGEKALSQLVAIGGSKRLVLKTLDAGDGITDDHGAWLEPHFR